MKTSKLLLVLSFCLTITGISYAQKPKYVFYLISDGTGINTLLGTEMMLSELKGEIGRTPLSMSLFPVTSVASTYSANAGITDSAASGTALATGTKTRNGIIGEGPDSTSCNSIAYWAKQSGVKVGIATSVCLNHATPSAFYAHEHSRNNYFEIGKDMLAAGYDFYGGSDIHKAVNKKGEDIYQLAKSHGYQVVRGYDNYIKTSSNIQKLILTQSVESSNRDTYSLPYYIDNKPIYTSIPQIMKAQLDFLSKDAPNGFLLINEIGGKVDFACHNNDGATAFKEVLAVDSCVKIALEFYKQHPDETLIVFTSDHETGGLVLGSRSGGNNLNLKVLQYQKCSLDMLTKIFQQQRSYTNNNVTWQQVKDILSEQLSFWIEVKITDKEEKRLHDIYDRSFKGKMPNENNLYSSSEPIAAEAIRIINAKANISWGTGGHSAGLVPVYACGVGAEQFTGHYDNAQIPLMIAKIAGYIE